MAEAPETREQLLAELQELRARVAFLEANQERFGVADTAIDGEEKYKRLVEVSPNTVVLTDLEGRVVFASEQAWELLGLAPTDSPIGRTLAECLIEADRPRLAANFCNLVQTQLRRDTEYTVLRKNGSTVSVETSSAVIHGPGGRPTAVMAVVRDITQRKLAEEALRQSHDELHAIYDGMFDGLLILDFETKRVVRANGAICRMLGYPEAELLSMSLHDLFPADEVPIALKRLEAYVRGEFPGHRIGRLVRKDGSFLHVDSVGNPLMYRGRMCVAGFFQDITQRRQAEAALRESEQRVHTICDSALDAVVMVDSRGSTLYWNPAAERMFGYPRDEMLGREVHQILPSVQYRERAMRGVEQFAAHGSGEAVGRILELTALRKDGTEFPIEMSVSAFRMLGQWCAAAIVRDVTERKKAREALERERRTLKHMLRASDHERQLIAYDIHDGLAQHLAGAIMQFDAFDHLKEGKPKQAADAYHAGMTMLRQGHFEARRLISGVRPPILDESGVVAAIAHLVSDQRFPGGPKIEFRSRVTFDRLIPLLENAIYRIIQEALTNACKYAQSALVRISMLQQGERLRVEIRDWGVGFDPKKAHENRFGLEGIRERSRVLGGKSRVRSSPGAGTLIVVELPVVERDMQQ